MRESTLIIRGAIYLPMAGCTFSLASTLSMVHKGQRIFVCMYVGN